MNRKITHISPSQLKSYSLCPRKWYFEKVVGLTQPQSKAAADGHRIHEIIEDYLLNGNDFPDDKLGQAAIRSLEYLPDLEDGWEVEKLLTLDNLFGEGVRFLGRVDLYSKDHIIDHKTTSNLKYAKTEEQLKIDEQAILYCYATLQNHPEVDKIKFSHQYILRSRPSRPREVTVEFTREELEEKIQIMVERGSQMLSEINKEPAEVSDNSPGACTAFGGCAFKTHCSKMGVKFEASTQDIVASLLKGLK